MIPEASAGCVCQFSIASTIVLEPRAPRRPWTIYSAVGDLTPVEHLAINLGAPGDRKDEQGRVWFSYPRAAPYKETALDVKLELRPEFAAGGGFHSVADDEFHQIDGDTSWIYQSWADNLQRMTIPVLGPDDAPADYRVRLHFADLRGASDETTMTVRLTSAGMTRDVDVSLAPMADGTARPTVADVADVRVDGELGLEFIGRSGTPLVNAIEVVRMP
jgi:hypothetical protein